jgi:integrase
MATKTNKISKGSKAAKSTKAVSKASNKKHKTSGTKIAVKETVKTMDATKVINLTQIAKGGIYEGEFNGQPACWAFQNRSRDHGGSLDESVTINGIDQAIAEADKRGVLAIVGVQVRGKLWQYEVPTVGLKDLYVPGVGRGEPSSFSPEEITAILAAVKGKRPWELFFTMLALTGLRASEILGLRVKDLDFKRSLIYVKQTAWNGQIIKGTKTEASKNSVQMTTEVAQLAEAYLATHKHELVYVNQYGFPYSRNKVVERVLHPIMDRLGIPRKGRRVGLHAFRHGLASMLVDTAGASVAQRQLRHSSPDTTVGLYAHIVGNALVVAMERIQAQLQPLPASITHVAGEVPKTA